MRVAVDAGDPPSTRSLVPCPLVSRGTCRAPPGLQGGLAPEVPSVAPPAQARVRAWGGPSAWRRDERACIQGSPRPAWPAETLGREGWALPTPPARPPAVQARGHPHRLAGGTGPPASPLAFRSPSPLSCGPGFLRRLLTPQARGCGWWPPWARHRPAPTAASRLVLLLGRPHALPCERARHQEEGLRGEGRGRCRGL